MAEDYIPVASLFASMGLDASSLDDELARVGVTLGEFQASLDKLSRGVFQKLSAPFYAAVAATQLLNKETGNLGRSIEILDTKLDEHQKRLEYYQAINEKIAAGTIPSPGKSGMMIGGRFDEERPEPKELESLGKSDVVERLIANADLRRAGIERRSLEAESNAAEKAMAAQHKAIQAQETATDKEYIALKNQLAKEAIEAQRYQASAIQEIETQRLAAIAEQAGAEINYENLKKQLRAQVKQGEIADEARFQAEFKVLLDEEKAQKAQTAAALANIAAADKARMAEDIAAKKEYANLTKQVGAQQAAADKARAAEDEAAFQVMMDGLRRRRAAIKDAQAEESYLYRERTRIMSQEANAANVAPGSVGALGFKGTAVELQAIDTLFGIKIPRGLTSVLARLGAVQNAMMQAFGVIAAIGFIEILDQVAHKIADLVDDFNGFGAANQKFWADAATKADDALIKLHEYNIEIRRAKDLSTRQGSEERKDLTLEGIKKDRASIQADITKHGQILETAIAGLKSFNEVPAGEVGTRGQSLQHFINRTLGVYEQLGEDSPMQITGANTVALAIEALNETITREKEELEKLNNLLTGLDKERERAKDRLITPGPKEKKWHDELHELPNILPWFMGQRSSDMFAAALRGVPAASSNPIIGAGAPRIPQLQQGGGRSIAASGATGSANPGVTVAFSPTIQVNYQFDGIPADVQSFMRDKAEPQLVKDLTINMRGVMDDFKRALKNAGVVVQ